MRNSMVGKASKGSCLRLVQIIKQSKERSLNRLRGLFAVGTFAPSINCLSWRDYLGSLNCDPMGHFFRYVGNFGESPKIKGKVK